MRKKCLLAAFLLAGLTGCASQGSDVQTSSETATQVETTAVETTTVAETTEEVTTEAPTEEPTTAEDEFVETEQSILFSAQSGFYTDTLVLKLKLQGEGKIYYTTDNTTPTKDSAEYVDGITIAKTSSDFPVSTCVRAIAILDDGTETEEVAHTYFVDPDINTRFSTYVFCMSGDPEEIYGKEGLLKKYNDRGIESEKKVFLSAFDSEGNLMFEQFAGVRVYGGASRQSPLKSLKLFARKSYDPSHGKFKFNLFDTENYEDEYINKYSKLVLRNTGNDMQFAYIRDEYLQRIAKQAGYETYEGVMPTVGYLNGNYYCFYWLHENYCDTYFKEKFGDGEGEFMVLEGKDDEKWTDDEEEQVYVDEYNSFYDKAVEMDLTDDANYSFVTDTIDVENYLDYFAFNIYIANSDWPNNNYKCFRYYPAEGEEAREGMFDGKWRYLLHDTDYSMGLYEQSEPKANHDTLRGVMNEKNQRFAHLFTKLMEREDCREYFTNKTLELMNGVFSQKNMLSMLDEVDAERSKEMNYYYKYLDDLRNKGNKDVWSWPDHLSGYMRLIRDFISARPKYMVQYLERDLNVTIEKDGDTYKLTAMTAPVEE